MFEDMRDVAIEADQDVILHLRTRAHFFSAGEASGDLYASRVVEAIRVKHPEAVFWVRGRADAGGGSAGGSGFAVDRGGGAGGGDRAHPADLRGVSQVEKAIVAERPDVAVLTDAPDFNLRLAKFLRTARRAGGLSDRSTGLGVEAGAGEDLAGDGGSSSLHLPLRGGVSLRVTGSGRLILAHPLARSREGFADSGGVLREAWSAGRKKTHGAAAGKLSQGEIERHAERPDRGEKEAGGSRSCVFIGTPGRIWPHFFGMHCGRSHPTERWGQVIEDATWDALAHAEMCAKPRAGR